MRRKHVESALRDLIIIVLALLLAQAVVLNLMPRLGFAGWREAAAGAGLLVLLVSPMLYLFLFRPLRRAHAQLEAKVAERTSELSAANQKLAGWVGQLEERSRQILVLSEMVELLQTSATLEDATALIARTIDQLCRGESWAIYVSRPQRQTLEATGRSGSAAPQEVSFPADDCWALKRRQPHIVQDPRVGPVCAHLTSKPAGAYVCAPMIVQGETLGLLHLVHPGSGLDEARRMLAVVIAEHVGLALANLRLRERLRAEAIRDPLTGLFNRRYMEESLEREMKRAARRTVPLGILMIDVDHFKRFNDKHGHDAGDRLLEAVGAFLRSHVRAEDIACRYGGEEFALIMPESPADILLKRAEELRGGVQHLRIEHDGRPLGAVTISIGAAVFPEHGPTGESVLRSADEALYRAKDEGRNRIVYAGAPVQK